MGSSTQGTVTIYQCPVDQAPHVLGVLNGYGLGYDWSPGLSGGLSELRLGLVYTDTCMSVGAADEIAAALATLPGVTFNVTEEPAEWCGDWYRYTPELGMHHASIDGAEGGDIVFSPADVEALLDLIAAHDVTAGRTWLDERTGKPWSDRITEILTYYPDTFHTEGVLIYTAPAEPDPDDDRDAPTSRFTVAEWFDSWRVVDTANPDQLVRILHRDHCPIDTFTNRLAAVIEADLLNSKIGRE